MTVIAFRERLIAFAGLLFSALVALTSLEIGRTLIATLVTALTAYGLTAALAALLLSVGLRALLRASKPLVAVAVVTALVLWAMGRAVVGLVV
ncbi:hypothetical protein [Streptomyces sp. NPDC005408]|uniref:hypothetical protein n=1 Tax=Streptomyces sp. NPDC005408 TaxID=3155341 RepID=UPI0033BAF84F